MDRRSGPKKFWVGMLLAGLLVSPAGAETVTYLHTDLLGSVVLETDQNRNVVARYEYEPYGLPRQAIADAPGYTGHVHDAGSGLVYMQQRYYDPEVGRFLSVDPVTALSDPVGYFGRYHYAANNPYTFTDPDGRAWGLAAKIAKVIVRGGDFAATFAGAVEDAKTLTSSDATLAQRAIAFASLVTEVASPVSARDVNRAVNAIDGAADGNRVSTLSPGPHAGESIPVSGPGRANAAKQREINRIGLDTGCHTCGTKNPGTVSGNFVLDHQPSSKLNPPDGDQRGYPHCLNCSQRQGGEVNAERRRLEAERQRSRRKK